MIDVVSRHGGRLDKLIGDGMFFVFGAPLADPRHATHAVEAALAMRAELSRFNESRAAEGAAPVAVGIGVHTGRVVAGAVGSPLHKLEYTVLGDAVNVASRVEGLTKALGVDILITDATRAAALGSFSWTELGPSPIRGRAAAVQLFSIAG